MKPDLISILVPTRGRPENVTRLIQSINNSISHPDAVEILFYVDEDDFSFPFKAVGPNVRVIQGPRLWLSLCQNILFSHAKGDILMYAADDIVFSTMNWNLEVSNCFARLEDKIALIFPNDLGSHQGTLAIHGFLHRRWVDTLGYFVMPGRGFPFDLWHTEIARRCERLFYLENVHIEHLHYRQGKRLAEFDSTYQTVYNAGRRWKPLKTYKKLERERRIDVLLLGQAMVRKPRIESHYVIGEFLARNEALTRLGNIDPMRLRILKNRDVFLFLVRNAWRYFVKRLR